MWLGLWWPSALWGFKLPSIQRSLGGLIAGQYKSFMSIPRYFVIWGSNKSESVISSLSIPWISGVLIHFRIWLQFHTPGEIYLLTFPGYIYGPRLWIGKHPASSQTLFAFLVWFLLSHRFEIIKNSKRSAEEALNGSASSCQFLHHKEGATRDALTTSGHRANSV